MGVYLLLNLWRGVKSLEPGAWIWAVTSIYKDIVEGVALEFAVRDWQQTQEP